MKSLALVVLISLISSYALAEAECNVSRWGSEDQVGNANLITAEKPRFQLFERPLCARKRQPAVSPAASQACIVLSELTDGDKPCLN